jgi:hypothetical protein
MYAYVENGVFVRRRSTLPSSWNNISGFDQAPLDMLIANGWYPLETVEDSSINLDQYYGDYEYVVEAERVVRSRPVLTYTLDELKAKLKEAGQRVAENAMQGEYSLQVQVASALGLLGDAHRTAMVGRLNHYVVAYSEFASAVDACNTKAELLVVYNAYPQLHGEVRL